MASYTAQSVLDDVAFYFPEVVPAKVLVELNLVHSEILMRFDMETSVVTIPLVQGTFEYAVPASMLKVLTVRYVSSAAAGDFFVLRPTSWDELFVRNPLWETFSPAVPNFFYIRQGKLGFDRPSPITTAGGFPIIQATMTLEEPLVAGTAFPTWMKTFKLHSAKIKERLARQNGDPRQAIFSADVLHEESIFDEFLNQANVRYQRRVEPGGFDRPRVRTI